MHLDESAEGDKSDEGVLRQQVQRLLQRVAEAVELLFVHAGVHHKEEHGRTTCLRLELILDSRVLGDELSGEIHLGDILSVVRGEVVSAHAEGAGPQLRAIINLPVNVYGSK